MSYKIPGRPTFHHIPMQLLLQVSNTQTPTISNTFQHIAFHAVCFCWVPFGCFLWADPFRFGCRSPPINFKWQPHVKLQTVTPGPLAPVSHLYTLRRVHLEAPSVLPLPPVMPAPESFQCRSTYSIHFQPCSDTSASAFGFIPKHFLGLRWRAEACDEGKIWRRIQILFVSIFCAMEYHGAFFISLLCRCPCVRLHVQFFIVL